MDNDNLTEPVKPVVQSGDEEIRSVGPEGDAKHEMIQEILSLKNSINLLIGNVRDTKALCEKYDSNNQYLQEYVGTLMKNRK